MPRKRTYAELAEEYGITHDVIKKLASDGVSVYNAEKVKEALAKKRHKMKPGTKLSEEAQKAQKKSQTENVSSEESLEQLKKRALQAENIDDAKIIKEQALALKNLIAVEKEQGKLIPLNEVNERDTRIARLTRNSQLISRR